MDHTDQSIPYYTSFLALKVSVLGMTKKWNIKWASSYGVYVNVSSLREWQVNTINTVNVSLNMFLKNSQNNQNLSSKNLMYHLVFESLCLVRTVWWGIVWPYRPFLGSVSTWTVDMYAAAASRGRWQYLAPERGTLSAENNCIIQVFPSRTRYMLLVKILI